jgi:tetratricopeptide (TPR) repeat protein
LNGASSQCYLGLSKVHYELGRISDAVSVLQSFLKGCDTKNGPQDFENEKTVNVRLQLGDYAYKQGNYPLANRSYSEACRKGSEEQRARGNLSRLKIMLLSNDDAAGANDLFNKIMGADDGRNHMIRLFVMVAKDLNHDDLILNMLFAASQDLPLLDKILEGMEKATAHSTPSEDGKLHQSPWTEVMDHEARGVLLYYLGFAKWKYNHAQKPEEAKDAAIHLWNQSKKALEAVNSANASIARSHVVSALANVWFEAAMERESETPLKKFTDHLKELSEIQLRSNDSSAFLSVLYASNEKEDSAMKRQRGTMTIALQLLSDNSELNDRLGYCILISPLACARPDNPKHLAMAISMSGQPDSVKEALRLALSDVKERYPDDPGVLRETVDLIDKIRQKVNTSKPSLRNNKQRIETAKSYLEGGYSDGKAADSGMTRAVEIIRSRLTKIGDEPPLGPWLGCDGRTRAGKKCTKSSTLDETFYHCLYCKSRDFCQDCFGRLRDVSCRDIPVCSPGHKWFRVEPAYNDMYHGPKAQEIREVVVESLEKDKKVMVASYKDPATFVQVEAWKKEIAREWGINLEEIQESS